MPRMTACACNVRRVHGLFLTISLLILFVPSVEAQSSEPLHFRVKLSTDLSSQLGNEPRSGRLIIFLAPSGKPEQELKPGFPDVHSVWLTAREVADLAPGSAVDVYDNEISSPAPFSTAPAGDYQAMALLDVSHHYAYSFDSAGDPRSDVIALKALDPAHAGVVELTLNQVAAEQPIATPPSAEMLDFESPALSTFWGRSIHMRGVIQLPPNYEKSTRRYPTVYWTHGFQGDLHGIAKFVAPRYLKEMTDGDLPPMIYVLLDETCPGGTHEFADSANNGPWGKALTTELIPYLEKKYRMQARPSGRLLTGHSSGGWAALWLQVAYPKFFGGTWPTSPDPSDFRSFTGPDIASDPASNFYRDANGKPYSLVRMGPQEVMTMEDYAHEEAVLGSFGGQMASFEWVFSPRGKDGKPEPLFDRQTGKVDPEVAKAWQKYNVAAILRKNAATLGPLLQDKIHLTVGTADTFHLDTPAHLLDETMKQLGIRAEFTFLPGKSHFDLYKDGLMKQIGKEMEETAERGEPGKSAHAQASTKH
jgi:S-formylglutathione hydrolase FrmB